MLRAEQPGAWRVACRGVLGGVGLTVREAAGPRALARGSAGFGGESPGGRPARELEICAPWRRGCAPGLVVAVVRAPSALVAGGWGRLAHFGMGNRFPAGVGVAGAARDVRRVGRLPVWFAICAGCRGSGLGARADVQPLPWRWCVGRRG